MEKLIKVTNRKGQCSITIPIALAKETGLNKADFAMITTKENKTMEVRKIDITKTKT